MSKKSHLFLASLATMLLAMPAQAGVTSQDGQYSKAMRSNKFEQKGHKDVLQAIGLEAAQQLARVNVTGIAFQKAQADQAAYAKLWDKNMEECKKLASVRGFKHMANGNAKATFSSQRSADNFAGTSSRKAGARKAVSVDANGIITDVEGEAKYYARTGTAYYASGQQVYAAAQSGNVTIVTAEDGTLYIKDIISRYTTGAWVKATKSGNTLTVAAGQPVNYNANYAATLSVNWGTYDETNGFAKGSGDITFQIDEEAKTISLVGSNEDLYIGVFWDDDNSFSGYADYETVWTLDEDYTPASTDLVELPEGAEVLDWYAVGTGSAAIPESAKVAFVGSDVYVSGIFADFPASWIKGTIEGTTVTFQSLQFLGTYGSYNIWAIGSNGSAVNPTFTFTYDAEAKTLKLDEGQYIFANAAEDRIYYLAYIDALTISADEPAAAQVDELPYSNTFNTAAEQADFKIVDANADSKTWSFNDNGEAQYSYDSNNDADDWLISPAIKLEAGKNYHFALDVHAQSSFYPERIEVKLAADASALAEGAEVIAATDVDWTVAQTLENSAITVAETGYYYFGIHAISDADNFYLLADNFLIEVGPEPTAPAAVTDIVVTPFEETLGATITFTAPATAIDGSALTENLSKIEIYRDGQYIGEVTDVAPGAQVSYVDQDVDLTIGVHSYQVYPYNASGVGQKSEPVDAFLTMVFDVPYTADLLDQSAVNAFSVIDANDDGSTWEWNSSLAAYYRYNSYNDGDDYLVSSPIRVEAGKNYDIVIEACANSAYYPERFEVVVGNAPTAEALTQVVIEPTDLLTDEYDEYDGTFTATENGTIYVAVHAISDADMYYLKVRSLAVVEGPASTAPAAAEVTAEAWPEAALTSVVKMTVPTKAIDGSNLTGNLEKIEIYRNGELIGQIDDNVKPGINKYYLDNNVPTDGLYTYQVVAYNANGERGRKSEKVKTFVGLDIPATVSNLTGTDNGTNIEFQWAPIDNVGENGGYVNPATTDYSVWSMQIVESFFGSYLDFDQKLATVQNTTSATIDFNTDEGEQQYKYWGVATENANGTNNDAALYSLLVGAPYTLPVVEGFTGSALHYVWESENAYLMISPDATDDDGVALDLLAEEPGLATFTSGKLNLNGIVNPTLIFDVKSETISELYVIGSVDGGSYYVLQTIPVSSEYSTVKVPLNILQSGRYAQVGFMANFVNGTEVDLWTGSIVTAGDDAVIDNIRIQDLYQYDLAAAVSVQKSVMAGDKATVKVTVSNQGENAADEYTVKVTTGEVVLLEQTVTEALAPFKKQVIEAELQTSIFDNAADLTINAEVIYANDLNEDNNAAEAMISIKESAAAQPTDLAATVQEDKTVKLTWNAPDNSVSEITEDFEDQAIFEAGSTGGITADESNGAFGDWKLYDGNGITVYGWNGITVPGIGDPSAWVVLNPATVSEDFAASYAPASGEQFLISMCPADNSGTPAADHWLISPELPGVAQTISFQARAITAQYGAETFEILASSSNSQPASFTKVAELSTEATEWTEFSVDLPEGTSYFAIRHTSTDVFGLLVDDIKYVAGGSAIANYNIYIERALAAIVDGEETTFTTEEALADGTYELSVSAVYVNGNESKPVSVTAIVGSASGDANGETDGINAIIANGQPVDIYTLGGKLVRSQTTTIDGLKGVYVVNNKVVIIK